MPDLVPERTAYLDIYVSPDPQDESMERICYTVGTEGKWKNTYKNCTRAMIGRYVTLKRKPNYGYPYESYLMNICEVDVYGYLYHGKLGSV